MGTVEFCTLSSANQAKPHSSTDSLIAAGVYDQIDVYYIADEPALHRNVYRDQDFLDQYVDEFHNVFQGKKSAITFAENKDPENLYPGTGPHYNPPEHLDLVAVDPYFIDPKTGAVDLPCERTAIRDWLYKDNSFSNINWAKQFKKPIIVIGYAQLKANQPLRIAMCLRHTRFSKKTRRLSGWCGLFMIKSTRRVTTYAGRRTTQVWSS